MYRCVFLRIFVLFSLLGMLMGCSGGTNSQGTPPPISVAITPGSAVLAGGATQTFTAIVSNDSTNAGVNWSASAGTISAAGLYTAPVPVTTATAVITATSKSDTSKSASATVTLTPISLSVTPTTATLSGGDTQAFTASVANDGTNAGVTWSA